METETLIFKFTEQGEQAIQSFIDEEKERQNKLAEEYTERHMGEACDPTTTGDRLCAIVAEWTQLFPLATSTQLIRTIQINPNVPLPMLRQWVLWTTISVWFNPSITLLLLAEPSAQFLWRAVSLLDFGVFQDHHDQQDVDLWRRLLTFVCEKHRQSETKGRLCERFIEVFSLEVET